MWRHCIPSHRSCDLTFIQKEGSPLFFLAFNRIGGTGSCHKVKSVFDIALALSSPFDIVSWAYLGTSFAIVIVILTALHRKVVSDDVLILVGISLENSVLSSRTIYEAIIRTERHRMIGLYVIISIWTLLIGTILTNWYKTWFTMEMIIPMKYQSPWETNGYQWY